MSHSIDGDYDGLADALRLWRITREGPRDDLGTCGEQEGEKAWRAKLNEAGKAKARKSTVDWKKVHATTEKDSRRHIIEDGENPDAEIDWPKARIVVGAATVRQKLGLSQPSSPR